MKNVSEVVLSLANKETKVVLTHLKENAPLNGNGDIQVNLLIGDKLVFDSLTFSPYNPWVMVSRAWLNIFLGHPLVSNISLDERSKMAEFLAEISAQYGTSLRQRHQSHVLINLPCPYENWTWSVVRKANPTENGFTVFDSIRCIHTSGDENHSFTKKISYPEVRTPVADLPMNYLEMVTEHFNTQVVPNVNYPIVLNPSLVE